MDTVREFVEGLELETLGEYTDAGFNMEFQDSDSFSSVYTLISGQFEESEDTAADESSYHTVFTDGEIEITCDADYTNDTYTIFIGGR